MRKTEPLPTIEKVELDRYLGTWYEVARKPLYFQNKCDRDVTATYTLNENGNIVVDNRCIKKDGGQTQSLGEAFGAKSHPQIYQVNVMSVSYQTLLVGFRSLVAIIWVCKTG